MRNSGFGHLTAASSVEPAMIGPPSPTSRSGAGCIANEQAGSTSGAQMETAAQYGEVEHHQRVMPTDPANWSRCPQFCT